MPGKHPKKRSVVPDGEPSRSSPPAASDVSAAELRAQMAILAEQVRSLGDRVGRTDDAWTAPATQPVVAESPPPIGSAVVEPAAPPPRAHVVSVPLAHAPPAAAAHHTPPPDLATEPAELTSRLMARVIEMAERAAQQIRESAEREAARIRGATSDLSAAEAPIPDPPARLRRTPEAAPSQTDLEVLERERQALAALGAETDRIEAAAERLRAQARALDAERQRLYEAIDATRRKA